MKAYDIAREVYGKMGVDTEHAISKAKEIGVSVHCWQVDDIKGFEADGMELTGGIQTTGNHPGLPRTPGEVRADLEKALSMIPGNKKIALHANYRESDGKVDRDALLPKHFSAWIDWAKALGIGVDFNSTFFSHPKSTGYTLSSPDRDVREFWIEHGKRCEEISEHIGREMGTPCIHNIWIPDGEKETPVDTLSPRERLVDSLDRIIDKKNSSYHQTAVESKLFGIGSESYVVGSHEFYMGYAISRDIMITLDMGHYHPTESVAYKLSPIYLFVKAGINLHISRPVRWDSDHVVCFDDEVRSIMKEIARLDKFDKTFIGTDFFDASINRVLALALGVRNTKKAILESLLQPLGNLNELEACGELGARLAYVEELRTYPLGAVWDEFCRRCNVPAGPPWIEELRAYERDVMLKRS